MFEKFKHLTKITLNLNKAKWQALRATSLYFMIGCLWILLSDKLVERFIYEPSTIVFISILKGVAYVFITSVLVFILIYIAIRGVTYSIEKDERVNIELQEKNEMFSRANSLLTAILESSPLVIIFALDNDYRYLAFNNKHKYVIRQIWGKDIEIGVNMLDIIGRQEDRDKAKENFDWALTGESFSLIEEYGDENLSRLFWQNYYSPIYSKDESIIGLTCFVIDVTDRMQVEEEIRFLSYHDDLTGLYNRRFYEEEIKRLDTPRNLPISIIMGDVNGLKLVNDAFGHQKGDELLIKAAAAIKSSCRADDIVARWGGDEFVVLLPKTGTQEVEEIIKRIKEHYANEYINALKVSISFGWDTKKDPEQDILKVLNSAEDYMYKHKIIENEAIRGNSIKAIINTLHEKNPREEQHSKRVSEICQAIGTALGLSEIEVSKLRTIGLIHDIGKIAIEEGILNKPGALTEQEWNEIKRHPEIGYRILSSSYEMMELAEGILAHHERWDGLGYPKGLKGEEIPKVSRIIALADSYDAMISERPYRKALSEEEVLVEIESNAGKQFDPELVRIFIEKVIYKV